MKMLKNLFPIKLYFKNRRGIKMQERERENEMPEDLNYKKC